MGFFRLRQFVLLACCLAGSVSLSPAQTASPAFPERLQPLADSLRALMEKQHVPGMMLTLVSRDSVLYAGGIGVTQLADQRPADARQNFRLGSVSKSFTALCILRLVREGKINLDDKLSDIAPEVPIVNRWEKSHPVRVVHLLEHTAGFDDMHVNAVYNRTGQDPTALGMVLSHKKSLKCRWEPGTYSVYSNPGYVVAGYLIEKFSGQPFEKYVKETVLDPLGMAGTNFRSFREDTTRYAQGYNWNDSAYTYVPFYPILGIAAGAVNSNASDMSHLLQMFLQGGKFEDKALLSEAELNRMEWPATTAASRTGLTAGYGLANYASGYRAISLFHGHNGGIDGFSSSYAYNRELGVGYALSLNAPTSSGPFEKRITDFLTGFQRAKEPAIKPLWAEMIKPFLGYYAPTHPRNQFLSGINQLFQGVTLRQKGDTLFMSTLFKPGDTLLHAGDLLFFEPGHSTPTCILLAPNGKPPVISSRGGDFEKTSGVQYGVKVILLGLSLLISLTFLPVGLVFLVLALFKKYPSNAVPLTMLGWLTPLMLLATATSLLLALQDFYTLGTKNETTWTLFVTSLLFGMGALITMAISVYKFRRITNRTLAGYLVLVGFSLSFLAIFLMQEGAIGLRMWAY